MERVKRLEEGGFIAGYTARLDRAKAGCPITAFVSRALPGHRARARTEPLDPGAGEQPSVLECHHVAGDDCYILKVAAPSIEGLEDMLRALRSPGEPASTRTTIVLSTVFEKAGHRPGGADD